MPGRAQLLNLAVCYVVQPDEATGLLGIALLEDGVMALAPLLGGPAADPGPSSNPVPGPALQNGAGPVPGAPDAPRSHAQANGRASDAGPLEDGSGQDSFEGPGGGPSGGSDGAASWDAVLRALSLAASVDHFSPLLNARGCAAKRRPEGGSADKTKRIFCLQSEGAGFVCMSARVVYLHLRLPTLSRLKNESEGPKS